MTFVTLLWISGKPSKFAKLKKNIIAWLFLHVLNCILICYLFSSPCWYNILTRIILFAFVFWRFGSYILDCFFLYSTTSQLTLTRSCVSLQYFFLFVFVTKWTNFPFKEEFSGDATAPCVFAHSLSRRSGRNDNI